jgi:hypothetical protein
MADATQSTMHADFPRWYREVGFGEDRDRVQRRWNAISSLIPTLDQHAVENILRVVFHAKAAPAAEVIARFREAFRAADDLFDMQGNDREVEVLCGTMIAVLLEKGGSVPPRVAPPITTSTLSFQRQSCHRTANQSNRSS